jgi:hypothetical protein
MTTAVGASPPLITSRLIRSSTFSGRIIETRVKSGSERALLRSFFRQAQMTRREELSVCMRVTS